MVDVNPTPPPPSGAPYTGPGAGSPLVQRAINIITKPKSEWEVIDDEPATVKGLYLGYACLLAAIPPVAKALQSLLYGDGLFGIVYRAPVASVLVAMVVNYAMALVAVAVCALVIEFLAPNFGAQKNRVQAFKVAIYGSTAAWVAGLGYLVPWVGGLIVLVGGIYSLYLIFLGLPRLMKPTEGQAVGYTVVALIVALIANLIVIGVGRALTEGALRATPGYADRGSLSGTVNVPGVGSVDVGKLEAAGKSLEAAAAAAEGKGASRVTAVDADRLGDLLPAGFAGGFARGDVSSSSSGAGNLDTSEARADYVRGDSRITLKITDMGGAAAFGQMASAFDVRHSERSGSRYEKVGKVGGRLTTEKYDSKDRSGEYSVLVGERFLVAADGDKVDMNALKAAVSSVGYTRLETMAKQS